MKGQILVLVLIIIVIILVIIYLKPNKKIVSEKHYKFEQPSNTIKSVKKEKTSTMTQGYDPSTSSKFWGINGSSVSGYYDIYSDTDVIEGMTSAEGNANVYITSQADLVNQINTIYQVDIDSIRNLSSIANSLVQGGVTIPGNLAVMGTLSSNVEASPDDNVLNIASRVTMTGSDFQIFDTSRSGTAGGSTRRALVHNGGDNLTINYAGDYTGGVTINSPSTATTLQINGSSNTAWYDPPDVPNYSQPLIITSPKSGSSTYSMGLGVDYSSGAGYINVAGNSAVQPLNLQPRGGGIAVGPSGTNITGIYVMRGSSGVNAGQQWFTFNFNISVPGGLNYVPIIQFDYSASYNNNTNFQNLWINDMTASSVNINVYNNVNGPQELAFILTLIYYQT